MLVLIDGVKPHIIARERITVLERLQVFGNLTAPSAPSLRADIQRDPDSRAVAFGQLEPALRFLDVENMMFTVPKVFRPTESEREAVD